MNMRLRPSLLGEASAEQQKPPERERIGVYDP